jgi:site-specific recombinase XerD
MHAIAHRYLRELEVTALSPHTLRKYESDLTDFIKWCLDNGVLKPSQVNRDAVERYLVHLDEEGKSRNTRGARLTSVKMWQRWLVAHNYCASPIYGMRNPASGERTLPRVRLSQAQVRAMIEAAKYVDHVGREGRRQGVRDRAILETLYSTACRVAELCAMNVNDVDLGSGTARVMGKGKRERLVSLGKPARAAIRRYLRDEGRPDPEPGHKAALFLSNQGTRIVVRSVYRLVSNAAKDAKIEGEVGPHALRHACATHMLQQGAGLKHISDYLGHANIETTQIYLHLAKADLWEAFDKYHPRAGDSVHGRHS